MPTGVGGLRDLDLVRPRRLDARGEQGPEERRVDPLRPLAVDGAPGRHLVDVHEPFGVVADERAQEVLRHGSRGRWLPVHVEQPYAVGVR